MFTTQVQATAVPINGYHFLNGIPSLQIFTPCNIHGRTLYTVKNEVCQIHSKCV